MQINPVHKRAALYCVIAFLTPVAGVITEATKGGEYPPAVSLLGAATTGLMAALVAYRAFIDGSAERAKTSSEGQS